jgi:alpha-glucosidase
VDLWWQTAVVYEIYPRSFQDSVGSGVGNLQGIIDRLEYLSGTLGVDAIWLGPFYPSPMADFGYDVRDFCDVDPLFGDLATFDQLVARAHDAGLRILVDFVPNHTSDQHPWFVESRASRHNPRRDWYVWRDPAPGGTPPNNWLSALGGAAWTLDHHTRQCYRHSFLPQQPDLNWRNPAVQAAIFDALRFWLERGVDGFRLDAVRFMLKDPLERDNPPNPSGLAQAHKHLGAYEAQLHVHDLGHADLHRIFRELRAFMDSFTPPRTTLAEMHVFDAAELAAYYGRALDELHMPTNFGLMKAPWTAAGVRAVVEGIEAALPAGAWPNWVLGTHDDRRLASRLGESQSRQAAVLLLTLRGSPTLYYGDELGMRDVEIPPDRWRDPWGRSEPELNRDGCRTPMQWSPVRAAGFSAGPEPWLPLETEFRIRNVATELATPDSPLNLYRRLLALRRRSAALRTGAYRSIVASPPECFAFERLHPTERALIAINFSAQPTAVEVAECAGRVAVSTHRSSEGRSIAGSLRLLPSEALVAV